MPLALAIGCILGAFIIGLCIGITRQETIVERLPEHPYVIIKEGSRMHQYPAIKTQSGLWAAKLCAGYVLLIDCLQWLPLSGWTPEDLQDAQRQSALRVQADSERLGGQSVPSVGRYSGGDPLDSR